MEYRQSIKVGKTREGIPLYKHWFVNTDKTNYMVKAHSYFTKDERKQAKLNHKAKLRAVA